MKISKQNDINNLNVYLRQGFLLIWDIFISANQQILRHSANAKQQIINQRIFKKVNICGKWFFQIFEFPEKASQIFQTVILVEAMVFGPMGIFLLWLKSKITNFSFLASLKFECSNGSFDHFHEITTVCSYETQWNTLNQVSSIKKKLSD